MTQPGRRRIGRFEILEALGSGAMGVVYRARDTRLEREVAVKVLAEGLAADSEMVRRFEQEARAASSLNHPNIVTVFDAGVDGQTGYIVTELLQGSTLRHRIAGRRLPLEFVLDVGVQIAAGLSAAHAAGLVHRDIKPENIFVTHDGAVKLLDFGIARLIQTDEAPIDGETATMDSGTRDGVIVGTPAYMAPEQIRGHTVDARTDLFAVGCVLYEMLFGAGPFNRPNRADAMAAALAEPAPRAPDASVPAIVDRIVRRCLEKVPAARFQSAADLRFALETASDPALAPAGPSSRRANAPRWLVPALIALSAALGAALLVSNRARPAIVDAGLNGTGPVVIDASTVVPASERPIAPAISPDGKWVTYIGLAGGSPGLYVQFVNGGPPVRMAQDADIPLQNRTNVGGIDVLPDGSGIVVSGRPRPVGLWQVPGIWIVPAPFGGPPRRLTERYASVRWSPDGQQMAAVIANPLVGDAVAVAGADGQDERVIVPASRGLHLHQVAWGHDGRYVYYSQTLEPNHALGEIYRAPAAGGAPEVVVQTQGTAMFPALTPDGRALIYAGDHAGHGLNIWWRPLDGSPERRLTTGAGEFTEPFISRNGRHLVMLARRRRGQLVRINAAEASTALEPLTLAGEVDSDPSVCVSTGRIIRTSIHGGRRQIWSAAGDGRSPVPITSGSNDDRRPAVSTDCRQVAFVSTRNGRRGIWVVPAEGGTPRSIVQTDVIDYVSWAPDNRRIVYATAGAEKVSLWIVTVDAGAPISIPADNPRVPAWSPVSEHVAFVGLIDNKPFVHVVSPDGKPVRPPIAIDPVSLPTAMAWSPDGTRLGLVNLPGRAAAEVWVLEMATGQLRKIADWPAPAEFEGISWTPDGRSLVIGRSEADAEVLLMELK